jgi:hypothetical protein
MSQQENQEPMNQAVEIEDLPLEEAQQDEVKGGLEVKGEQGATYYVGSANGGVWK